MLDPRGDSAIYALYTYARFCSILRKRETVDSECSLPLSQSLSVEEVLAGVEDVEELLAVQLLRFYDVLEVTMFVFMHLYVSIKICAYIYLLYTNICTEYTVYIIEVFEKVCALICLL
jgi:arginyl-tRNA synthetase